MKKLKKLFRISNHSAKRKRNYLILLILITVSGVFLRIFWEIESSSRYSNTTSIYLMALILINLILIVNTLTLIYRSKIDKDFHKVIYFGLGSTLPLLMIVGIPLFLLGILAFFVSIAVAMPFFLLTLPASAPLVYALIAINAYSTTDKKTNKRPFVWGLIAGIVFLAFFCAHYQESPFEFIEYLIVPVIDICPTF